MAVLITAFYIFRLVNAQLAFRVALCDSFNTPQALEVLLKLVSRANVYITQTSGKTNVGVLEKIAQWVGKMLRMFGLGEGPQVEGTFGWGETVREGENTHVDVRNPGPVLTACYTYVYSAGRNPYALPNSVLFIPR